MSDIDQQFIEYVVKSLVGKPDAVHIDRRIDEKGVLLELTVDPEDLGRVIGKRGATAQSLRTLLRALGTKNDARYNLKIVDNGVGGQSHSSDDAGTAAAPASVDEEVSAAAEQTNDDSTNDVTPPVADSSDDKKEDQDKDESSDRMRQTRAELAEMDDLDI
jgi:predicted RNA-binding protein YlqC (UPF0109 family)